MSKIEGTSGAGDREPPPSEFERLFWKIGGRRRLKAESQTPSAPDTAVSPDGLGKKIDLKA
jgi:hypothetical protein